jgi:hypothetical protein
MATSRTVQVEARRATGPARRLLGAFLLLVMAVGAFALWVGVPAVILWALGKLVDEPAQHLVLALIAVPLGMVLFGVVLAFLNTTYQRLCGSAPDDWRPRLRGPLDRIIGISAAICLTAFLAWLLFASAGVGPAGP